MKPIQILFLTLFMAGIWNQAQASQQNLESNKKVVTSFYTKAFNEHKPSEAMQKYVGDKYIQHNPFVANGQKPFIDYFTGFYKTHPDAHVEIKRVLAERDLVIVHVHSMADKKDRGRAVMDIFRLENGKIVEHWDVGQPIPEKSANENTMF